MKITGAKAIVKALENEGVKVIFGYPGATISPFYDALIDSKICHILTRHEQGAAHAANGYARASGEVGVCVVTSGPGATNLITGIATAYMDSIPVVALTGQVSSDLIGRDVFQEADITGAAAPFVKHSYLVKNAKDLPRIMKEAFYIASTGRPGPVLIDLPVDIQNCEIDFEYPKSVNIRGYKPNLKGHSLQIKKIADALKDAKKPVICAGGGILRSGAEAELLEFVNRSNVPVTPTLMGIGALPADHEMNMGMLGSHGVYAANYAINNADLLIILGARVGDRAMGKPNQIAQKAKIVHIDIDPAEIGKNIDVSIPVVGDLKQILKELNGVVESSKAIEWVEELKKKKQEHFVNINCDETSEYISPKYLLSVLTDVADNNTIVTTEVGQNQIWVANNFGAKKIGGFITSGGMGTMGYGLPAAVGAKVACPESKVVCIGGDGSFQMSMQELGTMKQNKIGVKVLMFNNHRLGMVRELQKVKHCSRYTQVFLDENPDFLDVFKAYGFKGQKISNNKDVEGALKKMFEDDEPYLLECIVDPEEPTLY